MTPPRSPLLRFLPLGGVFRLPIPRAVVVQYLTGAEHADRLYAQVKSAVAMVSPKVMAVRAREILTVDLTDQLAGLSLPVLYLRGTNDRAVPDRAVRRVTRSSSRVRLVEIAGPHLLLQAHPEQCWDAITRFIEESCGHRRGGSTAAR